MFESGNFKRRKRMRRHTYKPGLYKGWLGESQAFQSLYRNYPGSLYMAGAPWGSLPSVKAEIGGYGYGASPSVPLSSYTSPLQSSLSQIPSLPSSLNPTYHQYGGMPQFAGSSSPTASFPPFPASSLRLDDTTVASDIRGYSHYNQY